MNKALILLVFVSSLASVANEITKPLVCYLNVRVGLQQDNFDNWEFLQIDQSRKVVVHLKGNDSQASNLVGESVVVNPVNNSVSVAGRVFETCYLQN